MLIAYVIAYHCLSFGNCINLLGTQREGFKEVMDVWQHTNSMSYQIVCHIKYYVIRSLPDWKVEGPMHVCTRRHPGDIHCPW